MSRQETSRCQALENNSNEEQVVQSMSVIVKNSCFEEHGIDNLDKILKEIQKNQVERRHVVQVKYEDNSHHLKGCFCGIKAVRKELQKMLKEKIEEKQMQGEIEDKENQLENRQTMLTDTCEAKRQNINEKRPKTTTHSVPMDKDLYDYFIVNELRPLFTSIKECETETGFAIEIELNREEDVEKLKKDISALQNRFLLRKYKLSEDIDYNKFKDAVIDPQKKKDAMIFSDSEQKTVKVIGSAVEVDEIMQMILTWSANKGCDVNDETVTTNAIDTVDEKIHEHHNKRGTTTDVCPDRKGRTKDDSMKDDNTDDTDKQDTTKDDTNGDKKAVICDTNSEHQKSIKAKAETGGDGKKRLNDTNIKSEIPDKRSRTTDETIEDDIKTSTDDSQSFPDKTATYKHGAMGYDKKTLLHDTRSEHQAEKLTNKDEARVGDAKTLVYSNKSEFPDQQGTTKDATKEDDDKPLTDDDIVSKHPDRRVTANKEARGDDKDTLNDNTKSDYPDTHRPTTDELNEDDQKTTDSGKSHPDKNGTSKTDAMGHDENTLIDSTKSEKQDKQGPTTDNNRTGDDDKTLTDDITTSEHPDIKGACKLDIKEINAKDTMVGHGSMRVSDEENNVKLGISQKGKADDKSKEVSQKEAVVKFSKTGGQSEYDNRSQGNQSPDAGSTANNYASQQPTKQRMLVHRISMDEDVYKYIQRFLHQDLKELTALCNYVQELRDEASKFNLVYTVKYEKDNAIVRSRFQQLKDQVKIEEYKAPGMINVSELESVVHNSAKSERTMTFVESENNSLKIVGRPDEVDKLKKHIGETVSEQLLSYEQLQKENMHSYYSEQSLKQESKAKFYHQIPIDKDVYTYISVHCSQEIERASKRCSSITSSQLGLTFTIDFELKDTKDVKFVNRIFKNLVGQFKIEECGTPKVIDFASLASVIHEMNTSKEVMIFLQEDKQLLKLIGPNMQVSKTKKWIESLISDTIQSEKLSKQKPNVTNPNVNSSTGNDQSQSSEQLRPFVTTPMQRSNPMHSPSKPGEHFKTTSNTFNSLVYESRRVKNKLIVRVHCANITKENTDVLVSCEDEWLRGDTVLAMAMKEAAGPHVKRELANISNNLGRLEVGQVVHTSAGKLSPSVKYLVHAVRAQPSQRNPEDPNTFEILCRTFLNCLNYTNCEICQKSISIPLIGLRKYGVQMVSAAFCQAVAEYDAFAEATCSVISLRSIHFINQDPTVAKQMITSIKSLIE